jgi:hypothetical protein
VTVFIPLKFMIFKLVIVFLSIAVFGCGFRIVLILMKMKNKIIICWLLTCLSSTTLRRLFLPVKVLREKIFVV